MTAHLTQAIIEQDPFASDVAARMGKSALPELAQLAKHEHPSVRMDAIRAAGRLDIGDYYELVFGALDDDDINVVHTSLGIIEQAKTQLSNQILLGVLNKLKYADTKACVILMLGETLSINEADALEHYCTIDQGETIALHAVVALAKIGVEHRRHQFSSYLLSIKHNPELFKLLFSFIDYINQSWLLSPLKQLLANKTLLQSLSASLPNMPRHIRVCDRAVCSIAMIANKAMSFEAQTFTNFSEQQLAEAHRIASYFPSNKQH
ncbi:HEAT repeat domain-containing protein [Ningiella sp. W23]|uniref:HEAT repeat domain-containing protein n=1 Tax=Ningiella sp. W23 TaxID=3023715 RepID=UPI003757D15F